MNRNWKKYRISDVILALYDGPHATPKPSDEGPVFLGIKNITNGGKIDLTGIRHIAEDDFGKWTRRVLPQKNDIVFSYEATLNLYAIIPDGLRCCLGRRMALIRIDETKVSPTFLFYYFFGPEWRQVIDRNTIIGATVNRIPLAEFPDFPITIPTLDEQKIIAKVLSDLDAKIDLNNRINSELEGIAKLIYDNWFVQFDFPISEAQAAAMGRPELKGKPYKSSGGKMVFNKELKRDVPEGWDICKIGDVVERTGTGLNPRKNFKLGEGDNFYVTIKNIEQGRVLLDDRCDKISEESLEIIDKRSDLQVGDILFTSIEPVGTTYLIREKPKNWNINESVFTIRPDYTKLTSEYLYMFLSSDYVKAYTKNVAYGSIHKGIRHGTLKDCTIVVPLRDCLSEFDNIVSPVLAKMDVAEKENQELSSLRDWLLPMLMNGQVRVKGDVGEVRMAAEPDVAYKRE